MENKCIVCPDILFFLEKLGFKENYKELKTKTKQSSNKLKNP